MSGPNKIGAQSPQSFNDLLPPERMKLLAAYKGWQCENEECGLLIAPKSQDWADRPRRVLAIKCPHCGTRQERASDTLSALRYDRRRAVRGAITSRRKS